MVFNLRSFIQPLCQITYSHTVAATVTNHAPFPKVFVTVTGVYVLMVIPPPAPAASSIFLSGRCIVDAACGSSDG